LISSGDPVLDQRNREVFLVAYAERAASMDAGADRRTLYVGNEDFGRMDGVSAAHRNKI